METQETQETKELKSLGGPQGMIRLQATGREVKMNFPVCPESQLRDETGTLTGRDCRRLQGNRRGWWEFCESQGHNPYFTHKVKYRLDDHWETDPETGLEVSKGKQRVKVRDEWVPNVKGVAWMPNISSGQAPRNAVVRRGARRLWEAGYKEVCMLRDCPKDAQVFSLRYGAYCNEVHARAAAAAISGIMYPLINLPGIDASHAIDPLQANQLKSKRNYDSIDLVLGKWDEQSHTIVPA